MAVLGAARRFHQWDGKNTAELGKFTHCIVDAKRLLVESVIDTFCSTLLEVEYPRISQGCDPWGLQRCEHLAGQ
jgi:hypothetical protein